MPRVIDADKLIYEIHNDWDDVLVWDESGETTATEFERLVFEQPTVDAVKVVRCRNCKYYKAVTDSIGTCTMVNMNSTPEGYCAWAERETNEI